MYYFKILHFYSKNLVKYPKLSSKIIKSPSMFYPCKHSFTLRKGNGRQVSSQVSPLLGSISSSDLGALLMGFHSTELPGKIQDTQILKIICFLSSNPRSKQRGPESRLVHEKLPEVRSPWSINFVEF